MTLADLDRMESALARRLRPWILEAASLIDRELSAAKAHALVALTDRLKATPDGRASARRITRSPSYRSALGHVRSLRDRLCGASSDALDGILRDARASFYGDSVRLWLPHIPPEFRVVRDPVPTKAGERLMRGAIIHGYDLRRELDQAFRQTQTHLFVALNSAGRRAATAASARDQISLWHRQAASRIKAKAAQSLSDSDKAIHEATGLMLVAPEFRVQLPNPAGGGLHI